jgi:lipopolysaccharide heptosyltransferase II
VNHSLQIAEIEEQAAAAPDSSVARPQSVLIIRLGALGDVVHALPAAQALRAALPNARLGWVVDSSQAALVRRQPWIDEVIEWNRHYWSALRDFFGRLRGTRWQVAIDFQGSLRSGLVAYFSGARRRIGFAPSLESAHFFYNEWLPLETLDCHPVERNLELAARLGGAAPEPPLDRPYLRDEAPRQEHGAARLFPLNPTHDELEAVEAWRRTRDFTPGRDRLVVLNPYASRPANRWPVMHFIQLAQRLLKLPNVRVALSGGRSARETCDQIAEPFGERIWRADGRFNPLGTAALFSQADVVVTGDTGPMHLAAAMGAPIVALFGATSPLRSGPYSTSAVVLDRHLACSPCLAKQCPLMYDPPACLEQISVDRVLAAVVSRLSQSQADRLLRKSA